MSGSSRPASAEVWRARLESLVAELAAARASRGVPAEFREVIVVDEVGSTQDLARARGPRRGDVVVSLRQTAGRGRFGRAWVDTALDGVAVSLVLPPRAPEQLVARSAVAVAAALESLAPLPFGIKWPNDVIEPGGGKVAGILIEGVDGAAITGIGVNVAQREFPPGVASRARSLAMLGVDVDRLDVLVALLSSVDAWLAAPDDAVLDAYRRRDALRGTHARFDCAGRRIEGRVIEVDPSHGIRVAAPEGEMTLPAALTTLAVEPGSVSTT